jgi:nucleotide-binding universal stress UspA family protein
MVDSNKVFIAFDGSDNSMKAVQYAAKMFKNDKDLDFTLCGIYQKIPRGSIDTEMPGSEKVKHDLRDLEVDLEVGRGKIEQASQELLRAGIDVSRVHIKYLEGQENVPKDLVNQIVEGGYGTVIVGRRGQSNIRDFFFGRVSSTLVNHLQNRTVIVVE